MSKSGSKALSKSVDASVKSVVKSVESVVSSVVPKNMNMKHVLLAILVGLLLCMLMGNTVEGFTKLTAIPTGGTGNYQCSDGYTVTALIPGDDDGTGAISDAAAASGNYGCLIGARTSPNTPMGQTSWGDRPVARAQTGGTPCDENTGPFNTTTGAECPAWCSSGGPLAAWGRGETGVCLSSNSAPLVKNACLKLESEPACKADNANSCTWKDLDSYAAEMGPHTDEYYIPLLRAGGILRPGCKSNYIPGDINDLLLRSQQTKKLQLYTGGPSDRGADSVTGANNFATEISPDDQSKWKGIKKTGGGSNYYDFIRLVAGDSVDDGGPDNKQKVSDILNSSTVGEKIPTPIKSILLPLVIRAEDMWKKTDPDGIVLKLNGGRVIFGYNETDGFVFRNPPTKSQEIPLPTRNFHIGFPCAETWDEGNNKIDSNADKVSCDLNAACLAEGKDLDFETMAGAAVGGGICDLPSCKNLDICAVSRVQSVVGKNITETIDTITNALTF